MIRQTLAMFVDGYRDLNARRLFWVTLVLSAIFTAAFALLGADDQTLSVGMWHLDVRHAQIIYKIVFRRLLIGIWLTWAATILALISTAGIFPDFITGGSIDLYLSKPISRARLFVTKYFTGLLFVALQVVLVTGGGYLIMGIRGHEWMPSLFWSIPVVLCFFSYLFAICVLLGVLTRSTIAALLLTILCWTGLAVLDIAEPQILMIQKYQEQSATHQHLVPGTSPSRAQSAPQATEDAESERRNARWIHYAYSVVYTVKTITPKTTDTIDLLDRCIFSEEDLTSRLNDDNPRPARGRDVRSRHQRPDEWRQAIHARNLVPLPHLVIGTSLAFEFVIVLWAGWIFCRRDY